MNQTKLSIRISVLLVLSISLGTLFMSGCTESEDQAFSKHIFWDFKFGMSRTEFFELCKSYNDQGKVIQGSKNISVAYFDTINYKSQVEVNFYPDFNKKDLIYQMPIRMNYSNWAPWNKELRADSLVVELVHNLEKSEGYVFKSRMDKNNKPMYYSKNGPKLVQVFNEDDYYVQLLYFNENYNDK